MENVEILEECVVKIEPEESMEYSATTCVSEIKEESVEEENEMKFKEMIKEKKAWSVEDTTKFIIEVESRPLLWDSQSADYKNKVLRRDAFREISEVFATSEGEVVRKFKNLKTQFVQQLHKMKKPPLSCCAVEQRPKWIYFDALRFMEGTITSRPMISSRAESSQSADRNNQLSSILQMELSAKGKQLDSIGEAFEKSSHTTIHQRILSGENILNEEKTVSFSSYKAPFATKESIELHTKTSINETLSCNVCEKELSKKYFKRHMDSHKQFYCSVCNAVFSKSYKLRDHENIHTGERPYLCKICNAAFRNSRSMGLHLTNVHGEKSFPCSICGTAFRSKLYVKNHMKIHVKDNVFSCIICKTVHHKEHMKHHMQTHTEETYWCTICETAFLNESYLKRHMQALHTVKSCAICQAEFTNGLDLKRHEKIHLRRKPFSCNLCRSSFRQKIHLERHMQTTCKKRHKCIYSSYTCQT